jgi:hypothetical protein
VPLFAIQFLSVHIPMTSGEQEHSTALALVKLHEEIFIRPDTPIEIKMEGMSPAIHSGSQLEPQVIDALEENKTILLFVQSRVADLLEKTEKLISMSHAQSSKPLDELKGFVEKHLQYLTEFEECVKKHYHLIDHHLDHPTLSDLEEFTKLHFTYLDGQFRYGDCL